MKLPDGIPSLALAPLLACVACVACAADRGTEDARGGGPAGATMILTGGTVVTLGSTGTAEAIAIAGDRVLALGTTDQIASLAGDGTLVVDLAGRTVIPGLGDNHFHGIGGGPGIDLSSARSLADVLSTIEAAAAAADPDALLFTNSDWHEGQLREQRLPLRDDLDSAAPEHPLVVVRGGHEYILNSRALTLFGLDERAADVPGGRVGRYSDGRLNGELVDRAKAPVRLPSPAETTFEERVDALAEEHRVLNRAGLTSVRYAGSTPDLLQALQALREHGRLTLRVSVLLRPGREVTAGVLADALAAWGVGPDYGDEWLRVDGVKLGVDGGFEGGWMTQPYEEPWGEGGAYAGLQTMEREHYTAVVRELNRLGWRVATHAVGDAAIDLVLDAYDAANADESIVGERWVIEHGFIPREEQFGRIRDLGLAVSAQDHLYLAAPSLVEYWGAERAAWTTPLAAYVTHGVPVSLGTDAPVIPYNPFWVLYHFATRGTISAGVMGPEQALPVEQVLRLATTANAYLTFEEDRKGTLEPGMLADLLVLPENPLLIAPERLEGLRPDLTVVGGQVVWDRASGGSP